MSSAAWQDHAGTQTPLRQLVEQHSTPDAQLCPSTSHAFVLPGICAHTPPEQVPVQQLLLAEHEPPMSRHDWAAQTPFSQRLLQQSVLAMHCVPEAEQATDMGWQV